MSTKGAFVAKRKLKEWFGIHRLRRFAQMIFLSYRASKRPVDEFRRATAGFQAFKAFALVQSSPICVICGIRDFRVELR